MQQKLSREDIDLICKKYYSAIKEICQKLEVEAITQSLLQFFLELTLCFFSIPLLINNKYLIEKTDSNVTLRDFLNILKTSDKIEEDLVSIYNSFKTKFKSKITINNKSFQIQINTNLEVISPERNFETLSKFGINWSILIDFYLQVINKFEEKIIDAFPPIYELSLNTITETNAEDPSKYSNFLTERRKKGVYYTPFEITNFMTKMNLVNYINEAVNLELQELEEVETISDKSVLKSIHEKISKIKVLDPACGSADFLIVMAQEIFDLLYTLNQKLNPKTNLAVLKEEVIKNNIFGVDIQERAIWYAKTRFLLWYILDIPNRNHKTKANINLEFNLEIGNSLIGTINNENGIDDSSIDDVNRNYYEHLISSIGEEKFSYKDFIALKPFHWNLKFPSVLSNGGFDIIIGNPPYLEIKKYRNLAGKSIFSELYSSAYKLYDISILFIERALQLLSENGYLSFIITNKFLSTDFGRRIRELLLSKTKIHSLIDVSYLPIFKATATYPIIFSIRKSETTNTEDKKRNTIKIVPAVKTILDLDFTYQNASQIKQSQYYDLPNNIFIITDNVNFISAMENNPSSIRLDKLVTIKYRLLGFTNWPQLTTNISSQKKSTKDLLFIGATNVKPYIIDHNKKIRLTKKQFQRSYLQYKEAFQSEWEIFTTPKLLVKEIAKSLTTAYDPGIYANLTGVYMLIPEETNIIKSLLVILNSCIVQKYYQILFSGTHLSGGYLRFNGSYLKQIPIILPKNKKFFNKLADLMLFINSKRIENNPNNINNIILNISKIIDFFIYELYFPNNINKDISDKLKQNLKLTLDNIPEYSHKTKLENSCLQELNDSLDKIKKLGLIRDIDNLLII